MVSKQNSATPKFLKDFDNLTPLRDGSGITSYSTSIGEFSRKNNKSKSHWLIKYNQPALLIMEYIASKLYQVIIDDGMFYDPIFVQESTDSKNLYLGIKLAKDYRTNFFPYNMNTLKAREDFDHKFLGKKYSEFALKFIFSTLIDDRDITDLNNFAIKRSKKKQFIAVRFDFDDSFNFVQHYNIIPEISEEYVNPAIVRKIKANNVTLKDAFSKSLLDPGQNLSMISFFRSIGANLLQKLLEDANYNLAILQQETIIAYKNLIQFAPQILDKFDNNPNIVKTIAKEAIDQLTLLFGKDTVEQYFNLDKLPQPYLNLGLDGVSEYLNDFISKNVMNLATMIDCAKLEIAIEENQQADFLQSMDIEKMQCDGYILPSKESKIGIVAPFSPCNHSYLDQVKKYYHNDAVDFLDTLCANHTYTGDMLEHNSDL